MDIQNTIDLLFNLFRTAPYLVKNYFLWNVIALKEFKISKIAKKLNKLTVKNSTHETIVYYTIIWTKNVELTQTDYALDN